MSDEITPTDRALRAAARELVLAEGLDGVSVTAVAQRAGVARMTVYRRAGSVERLVLDALTDDVRALPIDLVADPLTAIERGAVNAITALRDNPLYRAVQRERPQVLLPYAIERFGAIQRVLAERLREQIERGQNLGAIRSGDADRLATTLVIALQGFALAPDAALARDAAFTPDGVLRGEGVGRDTPRDHDIDIDRDTDVEREATMRDEVALLVRRYLSPEEIA